MAGCDHDSRQGVAWPGVARRVNPADSCPAMADLHPEIDEKLASWIAKQRLFFVATSPMAEDGHVNVSPKGGDSFRVLEPLRVVYQDYTGSGAETAAHLRENGRIVVMFCAFEGPPRILRLHGRGRVILPGDDEFEGVKGVFPLNEGTRSYVDVTVTRVSTSCGYAVPRMDFREPRDTLDRWAGKKGEEGLRGYRAAKNASSLDGLPAFPVSSE